MIKPEFSEELMIDLQNRTGLKINRIEIGKLNFLNDTAMLKIFFYEDEQKSYNFESNRD